MNPNTKIKVEELIKTIPAGGATIIDVREPDEIAFEAIPGAISLPMSQLEAGKAPNAAPNTTLYVMCQSGGRSCRASTILRERGFSNVVDVVGGVNAFKKSGGTILQGRRIIPLMRQVQITAGSLVLTGVILALNGHPAFIYLSGFVGLGLILAGISGTCPMAMLLNKMPWNRGGTTSCTPPSSTSGGCCG